MSVNVSRCYYHMDEPAVAVCAQCGAGICRRCAVKDDYGKVICSKCGNSNLKQEHREYRKLLKQNGGRFRDGTEFIIPGIIGILINIVIGFIDYKVNIFELGVTMGDIILRIFLIYMFFSIPFCMTMLNDRFAPRYDTRLNHFSHWYFKICFSLFAGWIVFTFYLIRFIVCKIKS